MRLNSFIASCGIASRRKAEIIILEGRVQVNNKIVLAPFFDVNIENDIVTLDRKIIKPAEHVYYVINKPSGYVCAASDKYDPVIIDLLPHDKRIFPVGRLDRESEGLLILTNDGNFTQNIIHPSREIRKEYEALLNMPINSKQLSRWRRGFEIADGEKRRLVKPISINVMDKEPLNQWVNIIIVEGLKREIRLMAKQAGFNVEKLIRRRIGRLRLEKLSPGEFVSLSFSELYTKIFNGGIV